MSKKDIIHEMHLVEKSVEAMLRIFEARHNVVINKIDFENSEILSLDGKHSRYNRSPVKLGFTRL